VARHSDFSGLAARPNLWVADLPVAVAGEDSSLLGSSSWRCTFSSKTAPVTHNFFVRDAGLKGLF
jgi:hypothetical protein